MKLSRGRNPLEEKHELFKKLTRIFSGPLVNYKAQIEKAMRRRGLEKYASRLKTTDGKHFKKQNFNLYDSLHSAAFVNQARHNRYADFAEMDTDAYISAALDVFCDEMTTSSKLSPMLTINCPNEEIKEVLRILYREILNLEYNLPSWCRNMCKYGDFFLYLDIDEVKGIKRVIGLPVSDVERLEGQDKLNPDYVQFQISSGGLTLENFQVAHFRILDNDRYGQYGRSCLDSARRTFRQALLLEDTIMAYRIVRSSERRVFYLDVGNIPPQDVEQYMQHAMTAMKRNQVVDSETGKVDLRFSPTCFSGDTGVCLLDGRTLKIKDLVDKWNAGERNMNVYSIDHKNGGNYVPGEIIWAGKTGTVNKLIEVELDDGGVLRITPDHKLMLRDGNPIKAKDLKDGDSLMPFYTKKEFITPYKKQNNKLYEMVFDPKQDDYIFTHRMVMKGKENKIEKSVIHHIDYNRFNNNPDNLMFMGAKEHFVHHAIKGRAVIDAYNRSERHQVNVRKLIEYNNSDLHQEHNKIRSKSMKTFWRNKEQRADLVKRMTIEFDEECMGIVADLARGLDDFLPIEQFCVVLKNDARFLNHFKKINSNKTRKCTKSLHRQFLRYKIREFGYKNYRALLTALNPGIMGNVFKNNYFVVNHGKAKNHKVVCVREVCGEFDVYNVTVDKYFNLGVQSGNCVGVDGEKGKVQSFQSVEEDFFVPIRGTSSGTKIDTLPGGQYTGDIEDLKYIRDKLFAALKVPMSYVSHGDKGTESKELSAIDIRFARTIQRLQKSVISELTKIGIVHLYVIGYRNEDLLSFTLALNNPSKLADLQELEHWKAKFEVAAGATDGYFSKRWIAERILNISEEEFLRCQREQYYDKWFEAQLNAISEGTGEGEEGLGGELSDIGGMDTDVDELADELEDPEKGNDKENVLLAAPGRKDEPYLTPGAKGKVYTPEVVDKRPSGARRRSMMGKYSHEMGSNTHRNVLAGFDKMRSVGRGIMEDTNTNYSERLEVPYENADEESGEKIVENKLLKDNDEIEKLLDKMSKKFPSNKN